MAPDDVRSSMCQCNETRVDSGLHTMSWRTTGLLKSSGPTYVPSVTRKPPSTPSSFILFSRSFSRITRSFSRLRASLSCFVSRRGSSVRAWSPLLLEPRWRKERFCLLVRPLRTLYMEFSAAPFEEEALLAVPERDREPVVRDSLVELLVFPMAKRWFVSQARCGEALERQRIPRSKIRVPLLQSAHAMHKG